MRLRVSVSSHPRAPDLSRSKIGAVIEQQEYEIAYRDHAVVEGGRVFFDTSNHKLAGTGEQYLTMAVVSLALEVLAYRYSATGKMQLLGGSAWRSAIKGVGVYVTVLVVAARMTAVKTPICDLLRVLRCARMVGRRHGKARMRIGIEELSMAVFGGQIAVALFALGVAVEHSNSETTACRACFVVGLVWLIVMGRRHGRRDFRRTSVYLTMLPQCQSKLRSTEHGG
jgi:hypothetical protein